MTELCIDASVMLRLVFKGESHRVTARRLLRDCVINNIALLAPVLFESEVDSAVCKRVHDSKLTVAEAKRAFAGLDKVAVQLIMHPNLRERAREIAEQFNQRAVYDSTYAALAELRGCESWTADKTFYDAVKGVVPFVRYLPEYP